MSVGSEIATACMQRALSLAQLGEGFVEPNPMVGCVIEHQGQIVAEGWHRRFGGPHAEIEALATSAADLSMATMYVSLEPCCHFGKTPPCIDAIVAARIPRVVIAMLDPFAQVRGKGVAALRAAGVDVNVGLCAEQAKRLNAPYIHRLQTGRPWVIGKWAMTLDGKIASRTGDSKWISGTRARELVHRIRGRMDAIVVGSGTVRSDDPQLTARPAGPRVATRVVMSSTAQLDRNCQLLKSTNESPVLVVVASNARPEDRRALENLGGEVLCIDSSNRSDQLKLMLQQFGSRGWTNILVEGGSQLLGAFRDAALFNELHVFVAPRVLGGATALGPCGAVGSAALCESLTLVDYDCERVDSDIYIHGRLEPTTMPAVS